MGAIKIPPADRDIRRIEGYIELEGHHAGGSANSVRLIVIGAR